MLDTFVSALKDPYWVARVQSCLGVSYAETEGDTSDPVLSDQVAEFIGDTRDTTPRPSPDPYHRSPSAERLHMLEGTDISRRKEMLSQTRRAVRTNPLLHLYFSLATELGYEPFYITFNSFIFWSYDPYIGYRVTANWVLSMYIGQALKNYWRVPRPASPPAIPLELETATEYGAPSTHAMVGTSMPFYVLYLMYHNYKVPLLPGLMIAVLWWVSICVSRVYLGVHSLWDIFTGVTISILILFLVEPVLNWCDPLLIKTPYIVLLLLPLLEILLLKMYPRVEWWSMDLGDTTAIVAAGCAMVMGCFLNPKYNAFFQFYLTKPDLLLPGTLSIENIGLSVLRSVLGILILVPIRVILRFLFYRIFPLIFGNKLPINELCKLPHYELPYKFITYNVLGIFITLFIPLSFDIVGVPTLSL